MANKVANGGSATDEVHEDVKSSSVQQKAKVVEPVQNEETKKDEIKISVDVFLKELRGSEKLDPNVESILKLYGKDQRLKEDWFILANKIKTKRV